MKILFNLLHRNRSNQSQPQLINIKPLGRAKHTLPLTTTNARPVGLTEDKVIWEMKQRFLKGVK